MPAELKLSEAVVADAPSIDRGNHQLVARNLELALKSLADQVADERGLHGDREYVLGIVDFDGALIGLICFRGVGRVRGIRIGIHRLDRQGAALSEDKLA